MFFFAIAPRGDRPLPRYGDSTDATPDQQTGWLGLCHRSLRGAAPWRATNVEIDLRGAARCATRRSGALCGSGRPPSGGRGRSFDGGDGDQAIPAPRPLAAIATCDHDDIRRHLATSVSSQDGGCGFCSRPERGGGAGALKDQQKCPASTLMTAFTRARGARRRSQQDVLFRDSAAGRSAAAEIRGLD